MGVFVRRGKHLLRHVVLQTLVALSSGESEYKPLMQEACRSLGIQSHHQEWMIDVHSDSSAARSIARRRGIGGRFRHLHTCHLVT